MTTEKLDRRIRKTRSLLIQGLISLMKEKDIRDISVKELADLADINRGTFYLHYNDIYDMVHKIEDDLFREYENITSRNITDTMQLSSYHDELLDIFTSLHSHREITRVLIGPHGDLTFVNRLKGLVKERLERIMSSMPPGPGTEYYKAFVVSGYIGIFETWLLMDNPLPPEAMADLCSRMITTNLSQHS